jgi:hypothetical protein
MMVTRDDIKRMKAEGQIVITSQTFRKSVTYTDDNQCLYKGKKYQWHDWLLTYNHDQYERLIP